MPAIFTHLTLKIFDHIILENRRDPTHFTTLSVHLKIVVELIFSFRHMIRTLRSGLFSHMTRQSFPKFLVKSDRTCWKTGSNDVTLNCSACGHK